MKFTTIAGAAAAFAFATAAAANPHQGHEGHEGHEGHAMAHAEGEAEAPAKSPEEMRDAALVAGADVVTFDKQPLGSIKKVDGDSIVLGLEVGPVVFQRDWFMVNEDGDLAARLTAKDINDMLAQAQAS